jgi:hypothetical protein
LPLQKPRIKNLPIHTLHLVASRGHRGPTRRHPVPTRRPIPEPWPRVARPLEAPTSRSSSPRGDPRPRAARPREASRNLVRPPAPATACPHEVSRSLARPPTLAATHRTARPATACRTAWPAARRTPMSLLPDRPPALPLPDGSLSYHCIAGTRG